MFKKILIANRGEIACRVIRTARRLGIATVAIYSDADADARHVRLADEAIAIGPAPAQESYLVTQRVIEAALAASADAIHPGYGFLSENAEFAQACARAGIVFIGPTVPAIQAMGLKSAAKALMEKAGVPLTPGYHGERQDADFLADQAGNIGYPVLIKATAGGGGKGMRRVDTPGDFAAALASCQREAANAFGNADVLVEKFVIKPRHIEIQVFGDTHGNIVHLFERDCSVQRRHQKVLEEAPAPGLSPERRAAMGSAAVEAARAVGYVGAGTVEFIVHPDGTFYFMEMNTRLQVEHPVTEMITGLDLVEWQLRVANGEPLPLLQDALTWQGHAIEARIYAEDPDKDFLPSPGRLAHLTHPTASSDVRIDSGVDAGDTITAHYDPMIAKLIVRGDDRAQALARLHQALAQYRIVGVANNVDFLIRLIDTASFSLADLDTGLIEREHAMCLPGPRTPPDDAWHVAALAECLSQTESPDGVPPGHTAPAVWQARDGWLLNAQALRDVLLRAGDVDRRVTLRRTADTWEVSMEARSTQARVIEHAPTSLVVRLNGRRIEAAVVRMGDTRQVYLHGQSWKLTVPGADTGDDAQDIQGELRAPMPGKVTVHLVSPGTEVCAGAALLVMEAMKMEHTILAPADGRVSQFLFAPGDQVRDGEELLVFEPNAS